MAGLEGRRGGLTTGGGLTIKSRVGRGTKESAREGRGEEGRAREGVAQTETCRLGLGRQLVQHADARMADCDDVVMAGDTLAER